MEFKLPKRIYFTGFMATGKSRMAELTAAALKWKFYDTDLYIVTKTGLTISEIFENEGEAGFRKLELEALEELSKKRQAVIALGGGSLTQPKAVELVKNSGILVGLWAKPSTILERVNRKNTRPLLANLSDEKKMKKIVQMLEERKDYYDLADFQVESREDVPHHVLTHKIINRIRLESLKPLTVELAERSYPIYIEEKNLQLLPALSEKLELPSHYVIVTDVVLKEKHKEELKNLSAQLGNCRSFYFRTGEAEKSLVSINRLITYLLKHKYSRKTTLIAYGGGIVGDMVGFAASIFLRGVPFVQVPTSLLAMVDSSVGGKTGVNHRYGKNLIGSFYQPRAVMIQIAALKTLPHIEYLAGMAEVIKYAVIWDKNFFDFLWDNSEGILNKDPELLRKILKKCCAIKAQVVSQDEKESGIRAILNYGHTFGHAIETLAGYGNLTHGIAVARGMVVAMRLAVLLKKINPSAESKQLELLKKFDFPLKFNVNEESAWDIMGVDKKVEGDKRIYILPTEIGKVERVSGVAKELVHQSWQAIKNL